MSKTQSYQDILLKALNEKESKLGNTATAKTLSQLFKPLIEKEPSRISEHDFKRIGSAYGNFFSGRPINADYADRTIKLKDKLKDDEINIPAERSNAAKNFGRFSIEALSKLPDFKVVLIHPYLQTSSEKAARAFYDYNSKNIKIDDRTYASNNIPDLLSLITHESNHAIEASNPYINDIVRDFLVKKVEKSESEKLPKNYIANLYEGIQKIINADREFTELYKPTEFQKEEYEKADIIKPQNLYRISENFNEAPAFALQTLVETGGQLWNEPENEDSRKLFRRFLKATHQQYRDLGLKEMTTDPIPKERYEEANRTLLDKIESLRKAENQRKLKEQRKVDPYNSYYMNDNLEKFLNNLNINRGPMLPRDTKVLSSPPNKTSPSVFSGFGPLSSQPSTGGGRLFDQINQFSTEGLFAPRNQAPTGGLFAPRNQAPTEGLSGNTQTTGGGRLFDQINSSPLDLTPEEAGKVEKKVKTEAKKPEFKKGGFVISNHLNSKEQLFDSLINYLQNYI